MMSLSTRSATESDVPFIHDLLNGYAEDGKLLSRPETEIAKRLDAFIVATENDEVIGCASLETFTSELGEVRSLAVTPAFQGKGHGRNLVDVIERMGQELGLSRMIALTYVPGFFRKLGYQIVSMESLPEKVFGVCVTCPKFNNCDEIAMQKRLSATEAPA